MTLESSIWQSEESTWNTRKAIYEKQADDEKFTKKSIELIKKIQSLLLHKENTSQQSDARFLEAINQLEQLSGHIKKPPSQLLPQHPRKTIVLTGDKDKCTRSCAEFTKFIRSRMPQAFNATRLNAILDLTEYKDYEEYKNQLFSHGKGNTGRTIKKYSDSFQVLAFNPSNHINDIDEILASSPERQGGAIRHPYNKGARYLIDLYNTEKPKGQCPCSAHNANWVGIFTRKKKKILVGFIMIEHVDELAHYRHIFGHREYLNQGIMHILSAETIKMLLSSPHPPRFVSYAQWTQHPLLIDTRPGLTTWKRKHLFKPTLLYEIPSREPATILNWVKNQSKLSKFPIELLRGADTALFTHAGGYLGRRDLIHALSADFKDVCVVDNDSHMLSAIQNIYPNHWSYIASEFSKFLDQSIANQKSWDIVVCDPWAYQESELINNLSRLSKITNKYLITSLTKNDFFRPNQITLSTNNLTKFLRAKSDRLNAVNLFQSSPANGGCYWCCINFKPK